MNARWGGFLIFLGFIATDFSAAEAQSILEWANAAASPGQVVRPAQVFDVNYYKTYVNRENCGKDQRHYLACISSLQVVVGSVGADLSLKTQTTAANALALEKTKLALNANNLKLVNQKREKLEFDTNVSVLKQLFLRSQKTMTDFRRDFEPAYYHFKVASNDVIADVLDYINKNYASKLKEEVWAGAINEYLHISVDPHSEWRLVEDTRKQFARKESEFVGLGIGYVQTPNGVAVLSVSKGTGAEEAGLLPDDVITSVNGTQLKGIGLELTAAAFRGEEGAVLNLEVLRAGKKLDLKAIRKKVVTKVVTGTTFRLGTQTVGLVRLENFMYKQACDEVAEKLKGFNEEKADQVLLDLRGNGGGAVPIAECLAGLFLGPGKAIAYQEGRNPQVVFPPASSGSPAERAQSMIQYQFEQIHEQAGADINEPEVQAFLKTLKSPETLSYLTREIELYDSDLSAYVSNTEQIYSGKLAVLVDGRSASASELLAGAFRDLNRALIVGQTTFGKGSFQGNGEIIGKFQRWQTGGLFFQPSGSTNQTVGVKPHVEVYRGLEPTIVEQYQLREKELFLYPLEPKSIRHMVHDADTMNTFKAPTECLRTKNLKAEYEKATDLQQKDMQVLTAVAALECMK